MSIEKRNLPFDVCRCSGYPPLKAKNRPYDNLCVKAEFCARFMCDGGPHTPNSDAFCMDNNYDGFIPYFNLQDGEPT